MRLVRNGHLLILFCGVEDDCWDGGWFLCFSHFSVSRSGTRLVSSLLMDAAMLRLIPPRVAQYISSSRHMHHLLISRCSAHCAVIQVKSVYINSLTNGDVNRLCCSCYTEPRISSSYSALLVVRSLGSFSGNACQRVAFPFYHILILCLSLPASRKSFLDQDFSYPSSPSSRPLRALEPGRSRRWHRPTSQGCCRRPHG